MPHPELSMDIASYTGEILDYDKTYEFRRRSESQGKQILRDSGACAILEEMRMAIGKDFSDVCYPDEAEALAHSPWLKNQDTSEERFTKWSGGAVSIELGWNYKDGIHSSVEIIVDPVSGDIVVSGELNELIVKPIWSDERTGRAQLEAAITRGYQRPGKQGEPAYA